MGVKNFLKHSTHHTTMSKVDVNALKSEIRNALINRKANACPIAIRLAWHASGTYQQSDNTGGSDGATMRFSPESTDDADAGLGIVRDLLLPIKKAHPEISYADLWVLAGHVAIEFVGGPSVPFRLGRTDANDNSVCPANGRLPDAAQGAQHLRDVFHRMGFNDKEIVCLSGAHTLGRCHKTRSGFDGPWTTNPLQFDNNYFRLLLNMDWQKRGEYIINFFWLAREESTHVLLLLLLSPPLSIYCHPFLVLVWCSHADVDVSSLLFLFFFSPQK